jgi:hypothetical protein
MPVVLYVLALSLSFYSSPIPNPRLDDWQRVERNTDGTNTNKDITKPNDKSVLDARGSVGKQFTTDGALGGLVRTTSAVFAFPLLSSPLVFVPPSTVARVLRLAHHIESAWAHMPLMFCFPTGTTTHHRHQHAILTGSVIQAQKIGGPLDKDGTVGKQFTEGGILGGTAQKFADLGADGKARAAKS